MNEVTPMERDLTLAISDGRQDAMMLVFTIRNICGIAERTDYLLYLQWLVKKGITGPDFVRWWQVKHDNSALSAVAYLRQQVYNDHKMRPLISKVRV